MSKLECDTNNEPNKLWALCVNIVTSIIANALWYVSSGEAGIHGAGKRTENIRELYISLNFAMNLKLLEEINPIQKNKHINENYRLGYSYKTKMTIGEDPNSVN